MTNRNTPPMRFNEGFKLFIEKAQLNRVKIETDRKTIGNPRMADLIVRFFKFNNDQYLELINMEEKNNA